MDIETKNAINTIHKAIRAMGEQQMADQRLMQILFDRIADLEIKTDRIEAQVHNNTLYTMLNYRMAQEHKKDENAHKV